MYAKALKDNGSIRKAATALNLTKSKFMVLYKKELGLCTATTGCKNKPKPGTTRCEEHLRYALTSRNKEKQEVYNKAWRKANQDYLNKKSNEYYHKNHEARRKYANEYYRKNYKGYNAEKRARRRANKKKATPQWVDKKALKEIYNKCPEGYHVDHIIPLTHDKVCGLHVPWNLQYLPGSVNDSKTNKFDGTYDNKEWMKTYSHQYRRRLETINEDIAEGRLFDLKVKDFTLQKEDITKEIKDFIERYEWLGTVGWNPRWCFTARHENILAGVILISEPTTPSNLLGDITKDVEALVQRGAASSWAPKNLNSNLLGFAMKWMYKNTHKRLLVAYSDPDAGEIGTIYQACNFDYLGNNFGSKINYILPNGKEVSAKYFSSTSSMKRWCKELGITYQDSWLKPNGYQDYSKYPRHVLAKIKTHIHNLKSKCKIIKKSPKGKYAIILGDKREKKYLNKLKRYEAQPYPKRYEITKKIKV